MTVDITGNSFTGGGRGRQLGHRPGRARLGDPQLRRHRHRGNPQTFNNGRSHAVNVFISGGGTGIGTVSGNTING